MAPAAPSIGVAKPLEPTRRAPLARLSGLSGPEDGGPLRVKVVAVVSSASFARNPMSPCPVPRCLVILFITTITIITFRRRGSRR